MAQPPGGSDRDRRTSPGDTPAAKQDRAGPGQRADTRFARIFAVSPVPLALIAEAGQILDVNPALAQLLNRPPQQLIGRPMIELTHPDDIEHTLAAVEQVADGTHDVVEIDKRINVAGARPLPVRVTLLLLEEPGGQRHRLAHVQDASAPPPSRSWYARPSRTSSPAWATGAPCTTGSAPCCPRSTRVATPTHRRATRLPRRYPVAGRPRTGRCCSSTSTASKRSTTPTVTASVTRCWSPSGAAWPG